jgi:GNAT superfamily N-acetyltransferase
MEGKMIKTATTDEEIKNCFSVMVQLRPNLSEDSFVNSVRELMGEGYILAYLSDANAIKAVAGFKEQKNLFLGKHLYIEDLVTDENSRSNGYGKQMLEWLANRGKENGCSVIHLDSGVQRHEAHKSYLNQDMKIICYHFLAELNT